MKFAQEVSGLATTRTSTQANYGKATDKYSKLQKAHSKSRLAHGPKSEQVHERDLVVMSFTELPIFQTMVKTRTRGKT